MASPPQVEKAEEKPKQVSLIQPLVKEAIVRAASLEDQKEEDLPPPNLDLVQIVHKYSIYNGLKLSQEEISELVDLAVVNGEKYDVDPVLIIAMMFQESRFNQKAVSKAGAVGLMQILPSTAKHLGYKPSDLKNKAKNVEIGTKYLRYLIDRFGLRLGIVAYNQGEGNVSRGTYRTWYHKDVNSRYSKLSRTIKEGGAN